MHEMSIAAALMERMLEFTREHPGKRVLQVRLSVGELAAIEAEQLSFCYGAITTGTALEGSSLEIETSGAVIRCPRCSYLGAPKTWDDALAFAAPPTLCCPRCGSTAEAIQGQECAIKSVQYQENAG